MLMILIQKWVIRKIETQLIDPQVYGFAEDYDEEGSNATDSSDDELLLQEQEQSEVVMIFLSVLSCILSFLIHTSLNIHYILNSMIGRKHQPGYYYHLLKDCTQI